MAPPSLQGVTAGNSPAISGGALPVPSPGWSFTCNLNQSLPRDTHRRADTERQRKDMTGEGGAGRFFPLYQVSPGYRLEIDRSNEIAGAQCGLGGGEFLVVLRARECVRVSLGGIAVADLAPQASRTAGPAGPPGSGSYDSSSPSGSGSSSASAVGSSLTHRSRLVTGGVGGAASSSNSDRRSSGVNVKKERPQAKKGYSGRDRSILVLSGLGFLVGMGFVVFGMLVLLGFYPFEDASPQAAFAAPAPGRQVTYGSTIKLMHDKTKFRLHSHDVPYGTGSGQQSVTGFPGVEDSNSYWSVRPALGAKFRQGEPILDGAIVRLFHTATKKWLHSHLHASPISNNLEVSAFGSVTNSDTGDHWRLIIEGKGNTWLRDQKIRLLHVDTGGYLTTHDKKYSRIVAGQQEVCGIMKKSSDSIWMATEGIYFPIERNVEDN